MTGPLVLTNGQQCLSLSKDQVRQWVKTTYPGINESSNSKNQLFESLKFTDLKDTQTLYFYFDRNGLCVTEKKVYSIQLIAQKKAEFAKYKSCGTNCWLVPSKGKTIRVKLKSAQWFFEVTAEWNTDNW